LFVNKTADQQATAKPKPSPSRIEAPATRFSAVTLPDQLARTACEDKFLGLFWESYLPNGRAFAAGSMRATLGGYNDTISALYPDDNVLKKAILAMCMTTIGKQQGDKWMSDTGLGLYVGAMHDMSSTLERQARVKPDVVLGAARIFSLYEVSVNHIAGPKTAEVGF
jgi:hypothetical protein